MPLKTSRQATPRIGITRQHLTKRNSDRCSDCSVLEVSEPRAPRQGMWHSPEVIDTQTSACHQDYWSRSKGQGQAAWSPLLRVLRATAWWALDAHDDAQGSRAAPSLSDNRLRGRKVAQRPLWQEMDTTTTEAFRFVATVMKGRGQVQVELQRHLGDDLEETSGDSLSTYSRRACSWGSLAI